LRINDLPVLAELMKPLLISMKTLHRLLLQFLFALAIHATLPSAHAFYEPKMGRWLNRNPLEESGGINMYAFVANEPTDYVDPDGQSTYDGPAASDVADKWQQAVNCLKLKLLQNNNGALSNSVQFASDFLEGLADPLRLGEDFGALSATGGTPREWAIASANEFSRATAIIGAAGAAILKATGPGCFVEGTMVPTEEGWQPIEDIRPGDKVWAYNEETGEIRLREVQQTFRRSVDTLIELRIGSETIVTTTEHPFWVEGLGWMDAAALVPGQKLRTFTGEPQQMSSFARVQHPATVYNFEVEGFHTYFVSHGGFLVHNRPCKLPNKDLLSKPSKPGRAPVGKDGHPVELHHSDPKLGNKSSLEEMTRTDHRLGENFKKNHENTGQTKSAVDRNEFKKMQRDYWKKRIKQRSIR
jgi:hypothetical protein